MKLSLDGNKIVLIIKPTSLILRSQVGQHYCTRQRKNLEETAQQKNVPRL